MTAEELSAAVRWLAPYQGTASPTEPFLAAVERLRAAYEAERTELLDVLATERAWARDTIEKLRAAPQEQVVVHFSDPAVARAERRLTALKPFLRHEQNCSATRSFERHSQWDDEDAGTCDCGLAAALEP